MRDRYQMVIRAAVLIAGLLVAGQVKAGSLDPATTPGPTMRTLEEIYQKANAFASSQTLSAATVVVNGGYYAATNLAQVDTDLTAANIKTNVTLFGIAGTVNTNGGGISYPAALPKTGQATSYKAWDDGAYQKGAAWPNPRFTIGTGVDGTNCVTDNLTGLMWARNANVGGKMHWTNAIDYCENLTYGGFSDWRLPNITELSSLVCYARCYPAICNTAGTGPWTENDPFTGIKTNYLVTSNTYYWASTTPSRTALNAWIIEVSKDGNTTHVLKAPGVNPPLGVWPVRGGQ